MKVYLDNAATTPVHPKVFEKMKTYLAEDFGNPSSIHSFGRTSRVAIEEARETIAGFINANPSEIYFTSGGTEANNFSLFGIARGAFQETIRKFVVTSKVEHHSVLDSSLELEKNGFGLRLADVLKSTSVDIDSLAKCVDFDTALVSVMHVNNETGSVNPIKNIAAVAKKKESYVHTDAVQSFGKIKIDVKDLGVDALCGSAHKIYGPKGIGFAFVKSGTPVSPLLFGGSQERNRRGGTENVAAIAGFAEAARIAHANMEENVKHIRTLREKLIKGISGIDKVGICINGGSEVSPHVLSVTFKSEFYKNDSEAMLIYLDINGIAVSNGSACTSGTLKPSHVILGAGYSVEDAIGTIRFSFGKQNTIEEIDYTVEVVEKMAKKFQR